MDNRYPILTRFLTWKYKKKIEKLRRNYIAAGRSTAKFKKFDTCRVLLHRLDGN